MADAKRRDGGLTSLRVFLGLAPIMLLAGCVTPPQTPDGRAAQTVRHISVSIDRPPEEVYAFASDPENLPKWATGLSGSIRNVQGEWIADSPMGKVKIRFVEANTFGVLDHEVVLESGVRIWNPMRVVPRGKGSEIIFTLFRQPDMSDEKFAEDAKWVEKDLKRLKGLLEQRAPRS